MDDSTTEATEATEALKAAEWQQQLERLDARRQALAAEDEELYRQKWALVTQLSYARYLSRAPACLPALLDQVRTRGYEPVGIVPPPDLTEDEPRDYDFEEHLSVAYADEEGPRHLRVGWTGQGFDLHAYLPCGAEAGLLTQLIQCLPLLPPRADVPLPTRTDSGDIEVE